MFNINRIPAGIPGLDEAIEGGFPSPSVLLLVGEPGTGKTTFAMQSLFHGAKRCKKCNITIDLDWNGLMW